MKQSVKRYLKYIIDDMINKSEFEDTYRVIWTPWEADYYYDDLNYYEGNYLFDDYVYTNYGISKGKEAMMLWNIFTQAVKKKIGDE